MLTVRRVLRVRHGPGWLLPRQWLTGGRGPGTGPAERRGQERDRPARACAFLAAVPAGYILSEDDRALARPGTEFAARIGLTPVMVPGGHDSMLTRPDEVTEALLKI